MDKIKIYQFYKIIYWSLFCFLFVILLNTNTQLGFLGYAGEAIFFFGIIYISGFRYTFNEEGITKYWYFFKRSYLFSEIHMIVNHKTDINRIKVYFKFNSNEKLQKIEYLRRYNDYSDGIEISYLFQKKKIESMIKLISEKNPDCIFVVERDVVSTNLFLTTL